MKVYTVVLSPEPDAEWFSVTCPALPGAVSQGEGRAAALRNIQESWKVGSKWPRYMGPSR